MSGEGVTDIDVICAMRDLDIEHRWCGRYETEQDCDRVQEHARRAIGALNDLRTALDIARFSSAAMDLERQAAEERHKAAVRIEKLVR